MVPTGQGEVGDGKRIWKAKELRNYVQWRDRGDTVKMNMKEKEQMKGTDRAEEATNIRRKYLWTLTRIDLTGERQGDK